MRTGAPHSGRESRAVGYYLPARQTPHTTGIRTGRVSFWKISILDLRTLGNTMRAENFAETAAVLARSRRRPGVVLAFPAPPVQKTHERNDSPSASTHDSSPAIVLVAYGIFDCFLAYTMPPLSWWIPEHLRIGSVYRYWFCFSRSVRRVSEDARNVLRRLNGCIVWKIIVFINRSISISETPNGFRERKK